MPGRHPPHIYLDDTWYFVTSATVGHRPFLAGDAAKVVVRDELKALVIRFGLTLRAWVILDDHYHLLLKTHRGEDLSRFFGRLHGGTSHQINRLEATPGRKVWRNYWDSCIRTEVDLWTRFNYIHNNPVKHGYVRRPEAWSFSSYGFYLKTKGEAWLTDCWERYPVVDFLGGDDFGGPGGTTG